MVELVFSLFGKVLLVGVRTRRNPLLFVKVSGELLAELLALLSKQVLSVFAEGSHKGFELVKGKWSLKQLQESLTILQEN